MSEVASVANTSGASTQQTQQAQSQGAVSQTNNASLNQVAASNSNAQDVSRMSDAFSANLSEADSASEVSAASNDANAPAADAPPGHAEARERWNENLRNSGSATYELTDAQGNKFTITESQNGIESVYDEYGNEVDPSGFRTMNERFDWIEESAAENPDTTDARYGADGSIEYFNINNGDGVRARGYISNVTFG